MAEAARAPAGPVAPDATDVAIDVLICVLLFAAALALRWPHRLLVPAFADEGLEVLWGLDIAHGVRLPLTGYDAYDGPLFAYLMAAAFRLFGPDLAVPRTLAAIGGALTVPATFWLGAAIAGRWAGAIAAAGVLACPALVLYGSHYAWSNSLTPLFATATCASIVVAVQRQSRAWLTTGGVLAALTVQTHPVSAVAVAGAALWLLAARARTPWLTPRELRWPAIAFAAGYSPMLLANLVHPLVSLRVAHGRTYAVAFTLRPAEYAARLGDLLRTVGDAMAGGLAFDGAPAPAAAVAAAGLLIAAAVVVDWRRGNRFLSYAFVVPILAIPFVVKLFIPRYILLLVPIGSVLVAAALVRIVVSRAGLAVALTCVLVAQVYAASRTERYVAWVTARGLTNDGYFRLRQALADGRACGGSLFVEDVGRPLVNPAWNGLYAADYVLTLSGCEHKLSTMPRLSSELAGRRDAWIVMSGATAATWPRAWKLDAAYLLGAPAGPDRIPIGLYRLTRVSSP